ncbi:hypothetical protein [Vibrio hyugaensis]|uniref:hypothetical protein n=1 Tax=Vibrio hyugaensis TaxID=1534743 RepID=UPI000CE32A17|nr:hypothetical protein [Vibrio hyugaensis]
MTVKKSSVSQTEFKITIAKLIEVAYSSKKGITTSIMLKAGNAKLTVNQNGDCVLSGKAGIVTFKGKGVLEELGVEVKRIGVSFKIAEDGNVEYSGTMTWGFFSVSVKGIFNAEELILSCSGLLCRAARAYKNRPDQIERQLATAMGM